MRLALLIVARMSTDLCAHQVCVCVCKCLRAEEAVPVGTSGHI